VVLIKESVISAGKTKNAEGERDPEMHQARKGKEWHFGMKAHVGTDRRGIVHTLKTTAANVADISQMHELLHGQEKEVFGDQAYWSESHRQGAKAVGVRYRVNRRRAGETPLSAHQKLINRIRSSA